MPNEPNKTWQSEVRELLARAAELCADHDVDMERFLSGASAAYFDARPGLRDYLEEKQLQATLDARRAAGRMPQA